jgi:hypothetical protein
MAPEFNHAGMDAAWNYGLFDAILNRKSRRFAFGAEIPGGPTKYKSEKPPMPLDEVEEAMLVQLGTGLTGMNLSPGDLPWLDERDRSTSGNTMLQFQSRTYASPCGCHGTELFYWNDEGTYLVKMKDCLASSVNEFETADDRQKALDFFHMNRIRIADGRVDIPRQYPFFLTFNLWDSNIPGSTMFQPVLNATWQTINSLLLVCGWADGGAVIMDDVKGGDTIAGCERWIGEGLLNPGYRIGFMGLGAGASEVEPGFMAQNLQLGLQAMGLGGWVHASAAPQAVMGGYAAGGIKGLGFRYESDKAGRSFPVGIDGIFEGYCPPYFKDMDAAVDAVVETKFGKDGLYSADSGTPLPVLDKNEFIAAVPRYSDKLVQCVKDICNYIYDTYGRFPMPNDPMIAPGYWVQAHHLDLDFYDRFMKAGAYSDTHANHMRLWHSEVPAGVDEKELASTAV